MMKCLLSERQYEDAIYRGKIIGIPKEAEARAKATELCRKHGVPDATNYKRKAEFSGMKVSDACWLNARK